ncbi:ADP-ribosylglycohydrolase family protein [Polyangium mundeleinium]|uniref:ADP-ribosylglycohydrolase family protein n=1 Tax=Polyangium mundeleinium TaxID=2995306 RepID=A0ABT5F1C0_9BACT|nr:ADP-ribosylglycohydrolase family protein [Polyangium mundeleinium]MDC0747429.1 ADP-ribosylglycohydrolase family protein [Polyangium mundeleinium]
MDETPLASGSRRAWARGTLLGLAVGDALGTTLEFTKREAPSFPELAKGPHTDVTGGGPFRVAPGQVTDDTQMATCLALSLKEHGRYHAADVAARYVAWVEHAFDIGNLTHASLSMIARGVSLGEASRRAWIHSERKTAGNGSLMRIAPIGVALASAPEARRMAALADSAITHYDPRCRITCAALCAAIAAAGAGQTSATDLFEVVRAEVEAAAATLIDIVPSDGRDVEAARAELRWDLELAVRDDPELYGPEIHLHRQQGFVRVAFRLVLWELLHAPSYEAALIDVVNRGGDADTNGAITGALLGARFGEDAIPAAWRERVLGALADRPPSALRDLYHPRRLVELADSIKGAE